MKASAVVLFLGACVIGAVSASRPLYGAPWGAAPLGAALQSTGSSNQFRQEDNLGNYNFGYDEAHATGSTSRREEQINGVRRGAYSLNDADGRVRIVTYVADHNGFRASVQSNEPGVESKDAADAYFNKEGAIAAPIQVAAPAPLPVQVAAPLPAPVQIQAAPLALPVQAPLRISAPLAPVAIKGGYARALPAPVHQVAAPLPAPLPIQAAPLPAPLPIQAGPIEQVVEQVYDETPRAFSYSFGTSHPIIANAGYGPAIAPLAPLAPLAAPAPLPLPAPAPIAIAAAPVKGYLRQAPIVQQQQLDY